MADSRSLSGRGVGKRNKTWASKNATWGFAGRWHYFATARRPDQSVVKQKAAGPLLRYRSTNP